MARWLVPIVALVWGACTAPDATSQQSLAARDGGRYLIGAWAQPLPEARTALAASGARALAPLPGGRVLVDTAGADGAALPGLERAEPLTAAGKVSAELGVPRAGPVALAVHVVPGRDIAGVVAHLIAAGHRVTARGQAGRWGRVVAVVDGPDLAAAARALADREEVFFVERIHRIGLLNDRTVGSVQSGILSADDAATPLWQQGLRGEGQIIGLIDTGTDPDSCFFADEVGLPVANTWTETEGYGTATDDGHRKIVAYDFLFSCAQYPDSFNCDDPATPGHWDNHGHGTHIAGTMLGDADRDPAIYAAHDGIAPAARLVVQDGGYGWDPCADLPGLGCPLLDLYPLFAQAHAQGARVHNNSYGDNENASPPGQSNYTARTQDVDRFMWDHRDFLIVFAAGNSGGGSAEFSVGSPATNKNGLAVGSARRSPTATSDDDISSFSSRGWTGDGRIKPDVLAAGCNVSASTDRTTGEENCGEDGGCGTSYAAPVAVAAAALVRQYFVDGRYPGAPDGLVPSAALLKAVLVNSAESMTGDDNSGGPITPIPSNEQGWGRLQLDRTLDFGDGPRRLFVDDHRTPLDAGAEPIAYALEVADATEPLEITLAWTDYPGMPDSPPADPDLADPASFTASQLVNDLDLVVTGPLDADDGETYRGNVFADGASAAGGKPDRRNNLESVRLAAPAPGRYVVRVDPTLIAVDGQDFALVVTGALAGAGSCALPAEIPLTVDAAADVTLGWPADGAVIIERAEGDCQQPLVEIAQDDSGTWIDATAAPEETYGYRVRRVERPDGACSAPVSACVEVTVPALPPDAGVPDAGPPDASPEPDAGVTMPPDARTGTGGGDSAPEGDCGCRVAGPALPGRGLALLGLVAMLALVRLRRRRC